MIRPPPTMIVLDASAAISLLLNTVGGAATFERITRAEASLHAPHLIDLEVASALRREVRMEGMTARRAEQALDDLRDLPLTRYPHDVLLSRVWGLRDNASAYDAAYLALAEALDAPLVTCDRKMGGIPGHRATIEVIGSQPSPGR